MNISRIKQVVRNLMKAEGVLKSTFISSGGNVIRLSDASPGIPLPVEKSTRLQVQVVGGALYLRTPWDATYDAVQCVHVSTTRANDANNPVELGGCRRIPVATTDVNTAAQWSLGNTNALLLAGQGDDAPPQRYNGTTIGGNHRSEFCLNVTAAGHGKTDLDIGSTWSDGTLQYVIASIVDANTIRLIETATAGVMAVIPSLAGKTLTHVSGASNTSSVSVTASAAGLQPCLNNRSVSVYLDGVEITPAVDAVYSGARLVIQESYGIVKPTAHAAWLKTQVGKMTSGAAPGDAVECDVRVSFRWTFGENGSISNAGRVEYINAVDSSNSASATSLMQAGRGNPYGGTEALYVPDVNAVLGYDLKAIAQIAGNGSLSGTVYVDSASWVDPKSPPNRMAYLVLVSGSPKIGQVLGSSPLRGVTSRGRYAANTDRAGYFSTAKKSYPHIQNRLVYGNTVPAGSIVSGTAYRHIYNPTATPDATVATWYWDGDEIVVTVDFHRTSSMCAISLPVVTEGWSITTIESTAVTLISPVVDGGRLAVSCSATYGHAQFRIAPF